MRHIAPAGTPISLKDLGSWLYNLAAPNNTIARFEEEICNRYHVKHCFFVSTGRAALTLLLRSLSELTGDVRNEVVIPSYTCFSVPSSIAKAGLKIRICDIDINTLDYDLQKLAAIDLTNVLCIVTANLYGIPNDLIQLSRIAEDNGVFLIDDAAQCMGGKVDGKFSGTFGDAGIYSLDKGKNITSIEGGIIVTNSDDIASLIKSKVAALQNITVIKKISYISKIFIYAAFLRPNLYWIPENTPFLNLGVTLYTTKYPIGSYSPMLGAMGFQLYKKIDEITRIRIKNAQYLRENLDKLQFIKVPKHKDYITPVYLRFPVLVQGKELRDKIVIRLNETGIGATTSYPTSIIDINEIQDIIVNKNTKAEGGKQAAEEIVTFPTHPYMTENDLYRIVSVVNEAIN